MATQTQAVCDEVVSKQFADYNNDNQFESPSPIGPQPDIPVGVYAIELSWDRRPERFSAEYREMAKAANDKGGLFRIIIKTLKDMPNGGKWHFKKLQGNVQVLGTDPKKGRMHLWGMARMDEQCLSLYRDPAATLHPVVEGEELPASYQRLCFYRQIEKWRLRDERLTRQLAAKIGWPSAMSDPRTLKLVQNCVGDWFCAWPEEDHVGHVFAAGDTKVILDSSGTAHLYDPTLNYG